MDLKKILTISGKPGLYRLISQRKGNIIVESLLDKSRMPVFASMRASSLDDICIFTTEEDLPLKDAFKRIFEAKEGKRAEVSSDNVGWKKHMEEILPQYDKERVHVSDMKKLFVWYNLLHDNNLLLFEEEVSEEQSPTETEKEKEAE
ncbi:MAG: DUF5606 domain-containing protein [Bacteroidales bacterium]|jgi:hypothetical protein|nr:DUF5606 domain-containing protein [Bacteroidales bacterium]